MSGTLRGLDRFAVRSGPAPDPERGPGRPVPERSAPRPPGGEAAQEPLRSPHRHGTLRIGPLRGPIVSDPAPGGEAARVPGPPSGTDPNRTRNGYGGEAAMGSCLCVVVGWRFDALLGACVGGVVFRCFCGGTCWCSGVVVLVLVGGVLCGVCVLVVGCFDVLVFGCCGGWVMWCGGVLVGCHHRVGYVGLVAACWDMTCRRVFPWPLSSISPWPVAYNGTCSPSPTRTSPPRAHILPTVQGTGPGGPVPAATGASSSGRRRCGRMIGSGAVRATT